MMNALPLPNLWILHASLPSYGRVRSALISQDIGHVVFADGYDRALMIERMEAGSRCFIGLKRPGTQCLYDAGSEVRLVEVNGKRFLSTGGPLVARDVLDGVERKTVMRGGEASTVSVKRLG